MVKTATLMNQKDNSPSAGSMQLDRRRFIQGITSAAFLAATPSLLYGAGGLPASNPIPVLTGKKIDLVIDQLPVNYTGLARIATSINGSVPAPTLRLREGDDVVISVTNRLAVPTSIHWHGIILPYQMDGVPGISFKGIMPGETFVYRFKLQQSGTYWYHSHSGFQEMTGMYGALIVEPRDGERIRADRQHVVQLSDWTDAVPMDVFRKLKVQSDFYNFNQPSAGDFLRDVKQAGLGDALASRKMWNQMRMSPTDLADLSNATLSYLLNGQPSSNAWTGLFRSGERVRLRFINGSSNSFYDLRIPGLKMTIVQADGQDVEPVTVDEFRFGPGETYDAIVQPRDDAYTIFAQSMDRTGYAAGTLAIVDGLKAPVPKMDSPVSLTMLDMMGDMKAMPGMVGMPGMKGMPGMERMPGMATQKDNHESPTGEMGSGKMNHAAMGHTNMQQGDMSHGGMAMDHSQHRVNPLQKPSSEVLHARSEYGASVDQRVAQHRTNLDDPGIGLRDNGRRVLTLEDLRSVNNILLDQRTAEREIELHLTGNMERYSWSFDGLEFGDSTPVSMKHGERVRVILRNDTMMTHPMHLHGMWSDLENDQGDLLVRRHTIPVQPAQSVSFLTTPHDLGRWAWHCHLLFHMDAGMFREVVVS
tara:strand:+ start:16845 stop:18776 length:1932 start_codon:yes stop_codon:yes gene_type:complete